MHHRHGLLAHADDAAMQALHVVAESQVVGAGVGLAVGTLGAIVGCAVGSVGPAVGSGDGACVGPVVGVQPHSRSAAVLRWLHAKSR